MPIESEFEHRGYIVRLKGLHRSEFRYFILTAHGPQYGTAHSILEARRQAVHVINELTGAIDWIAATGAIQCTTSDRDDIRRVSTIR